MSIEEKALVDKLKTYVVMWSDEKELFEIYLKEKKQKMTNDNWISVH